MSSSSIRIACLKHAARHSFPVTCPCISASAVPIRRAMMSALRSRKDHPPSLADSPTVVAPSATSLSLDAASPQTAARPPPVPKSEKMRPRLRPTKAAITITQSAVKRLRDLLSGPTPSLIRIGVRNKGCAGLSYHLEYVEEPAQFDEVIEQDGVRVIIDSKALFSIIGSEMDWEENQLSSRFIFKNPNIKDACGCGESFNVGS